MYRISVSTILNIARELENESTRSKNDGSGNPEYNLIQARRIQAIVRKLRFATETVFNEKGKDR